MNRILSLVFLLVISAYNISGSESPLKPNYSTAALEQAAKNQSHMIALAMRLMACESGNQGAQPNRCEELNASYKKETEMLGNNMARILVDKEN